ncbi:hypothetical protein PFICI_15101 [Pestalotiopsis fici W106-1]|uniref:AB hydrolase-1 domain-containing protein n=1 Tax=Pestalotiopsis fici (strain W106-1 / CGMCC3.15140) TaxID=1229662 RepID=W3WK17_PESFW|nr:uncharacterized protein PFICI_15101 [Pestalotiopsis fici W106-1]ETS73156.1 hypothetical protein PFICI_15101 [Pestalotiopsis fici W106-1]
MIGTSLYQFVFIRACIFALHYTSPLLLLALGIQLVAIGRSALSWRINQLFIAYCIVDLLYAVLIWWPYNKRLKDEARHPPPLSSADRRALFLKCADHIPDLERYLRLWFLGADSLDIKRDNVHDFVLWAFFDTVPERASQQDVFEAEELVDLLEDRLGRKLDAGRGKARGLCLTIDAIETRYRSFIWYIIVGLVDLFTHFQFAWLGFEYFAQPRSEAFSVTPPRLQSLFASKQSASRQLSYWHRPHTAADKSPVVFLHGIGIGLWTYVPFLSRIGGNNTGSGDIGVIAIEILPVSFRLTDAPLSKLELLSQLDTILDSHEWGDFVLAGHSYGTVLASHMIHSRTFNSRLQGVVLLDPVSIMLHLPDVAYNFTRRKPSRANEWQLWYFASMDPGVAHALARHFFWRENIIWKEELLDRSTNERTRDSHGISTRKVAVCLSERDLIVDTLSVAEYLADGEDWTPSTGSDVGDEMLHRDLHVTRDGIEILWFPGLDHGQMFEKRENQDRVCRVIDSYCA